MRPRWSRVRPCWCNQADDAHDVQQPRYVASDAHLGARHPYAPSVGDDHPGRLEQPYRVVPDLDDLLALLGSHAAFFGLLEDALYDALGLRGAFVYVYGEDAGLVLVMEVDPVVVCTTTVGPSFSWTTLRMVPSASFSVAS